MTEQEQYIKMCDHPLIQDEWVPKIGDWTDKGFVVTKLRNRDKNDKILWKIAEIQYYFTKEKLVWLPTQEQLQEMVSSDLKYLFKRLTDVSFDGLDLEWCESMRQLWLAFVMWELHGLEWSKEKPKTPQWRSAYPRRRRRVFKRMNPAQR